MKKKLIINADDFGMSKEINDGIKIGIEQGVVKSVSVMSNMPYFDDAIAYLKKNPKVSVGLHFNITEGKPLIHPYLASNLIREDDSFYFWLNMIPRVSLRAIKLDEIEAELEAQYAKLHATGLRVTHIDSHHHIHLYPRIFQLVSNFSDKKNILSLRGDEFNQWNITLGFRKLPIATQLIVNMMLLYSHLRYRRRKRFSKISGFYDVNWGKNLTPEQFISILKTIPDEKTELIAHLAVESEKGNRKFLAPRFRALQLLTHPSVKQYLTKQDIELISHLNKELKRAS